jgi:SAM-dependent methyltransferase
VANGVPVFGRAQLTTAQLAEISHDRRWLAEHRSDTEWAGVPESNHGWSRPWIDARVLSDPTTCVVCIGGSFADDLPTVRALNKFNIDHLADVYAELAAPEVAGQDTTFVACPAETLPFATSTVDLVYSRNALDHFDNPLVVLEEIHRVLKPGGTVLLACYFDSTFLDAAETKVIDHDFLDRYVGALFEERHRELEAVPPQIVVGPTSTRWLSYAGTPRPGGRLPIDAETVEWAAFLANTFQRALAERVANDDKARESFAATLERPPVMPTDAHRQVFASLQLLAMFDDKALLAAAQTIRDHGLGPDWREAADLTLGLYGWTLDDAPLPGADQAVECPLLAEWQWYAALSLSAAALGRTEPARDLRDIAATKSAGASAWIDGATFAAG